MSTKNLVPTAGSKPPQRRKPRRRRISTTAVLAIVNGVLVGVATVYATTHSVPVTLIAAVAAVPLADFALV